jgi:hypothetical protein
LLILPSSRHTLLCCSANHFFSTFCKINCNCKLKMVLSRYALEHCDRRMNISPFFYVQFDIRP